MTPNRLAFLLLCLWLSGCGVPSPGPGSPAPLSGDPVAGVSVASQPVPNAGGPVEIGGVFNARHVGQLIAGSKRLRDHILMRSGDLSAITSAGCAMLDTLKVRAIIDLRDEPDLSNRPDAACGSTARAYVQVTLPKLLPPSVGNYNAMLDALEPKTAALFAALAVADGPVLIHCVIGRDRAMLTTALVLLALGVEPRMVIMDAATNHDPSVTVDAAWFTGLVSRVQAAGGIEGYLAIHGVAAGQLAELRGEMTEE